MEIKRELKTTWRTTCDRHRKTVEAVLSVALGGEPGGIPCRQASKRRETGGVITNGMQEHKFGPWRMYTRTGSRGGKQSVRGTKGEEAKKKDWCCHVTLGSPEHSYRILCVSRSGDTGSGTRYLLPSLLYYLVAGLLRFCYWRLAWTESR